MCNSVTSAESSIQFSLNRTLAQTNSPAVPSSNSTNGNAATGAQAPASAYPHLGKQLNLTV